MAAYYTTRAGMELLTRDAWTDILAKPQGIASTPQPAQYSRNWQEDMLLGESPVMQSAGHAMTTPTD